MQDLTKIQVRELSNIKILDGTSVKQKNIDNYYLMKDVDALISDYSSAPNDFLHADKPIAYCLDDMDDYKLGFIVEDPRTLMAGHLLYKTSDLRSFLIDIRNNRDLFKKERHELFNYIFDYHDGKSSERLIEYLKL